MPVGQHAVEAQLPAASSAYGLEKGRMLIPDDTPQAGEEGVAVAQVGDAPVGPACEGRIAISRWRWRVTVEQGDPAARGGEGQGGPEPGHARADDDDVFAHVSLASLAGPSGPLGWRPSGRRHRLRE